MSAALAVCALYFAVFIAIGFAVDRRGSKTAESFYLGDRNFGAVPTALSVGASDSSGWVFTGAVGFAYVYGASMMWICVGYTLGIFCNYVFVAPALRRFTRQTGAASLPHYFALRFPECGARLRLASSALIAVFFTVSAAGQLTSAGKVFEAAGFSYGAAVWAAAFAATFYTFLGGFLAESASDFMQAVVMVLALILVLTFGTIAAGGPAAVFENLSSIPGFLEVASTANPLTGADGNQMITDGLPLFADASPYGVISALSMLAWGLGYFGMPQVLLRFMAIRHREELRKSRRIATVWCVVSLFAAIAIGLMGRALYPAVFTTNSDAETIFSYIASTLMHPLFAGLVSAGILAATISSSDSYLLIAASAFSKNLWQRLFRKKASDKEIMQVGRIALVSIAVIGALIAMDEDSVIFTIVSFAWAGFGATFGPLMLFSLFWKRTTRSGAVAGMISGGVMVFVWNFLIKPFGGIFAIYELLPAFIVSSIFIVVVSLLSPEPDDEVKREFDMARN